jgi:PAS domain S-box-containing protein
MTASDSNESPPLSGLPIWIPLLAFILLTFLIGAAGYAIFEQNKKSITEKEIQSLGAIADLKVAQIVAWREANRRRAEMFLHGSLLPDEVDLWLREGAPAGKRKEKILQVLTGLRQVQNFKTVSLLDQEGAARISTDGSYAPDADEKKLAIEAMRSQSVLFSDLHREGRRGNGIEIDSVAPLRVTDEKKANRIVGALLFEIDPNTFLYPLVQSWPIKSLSTETLLVKRDGGDVLFLNELRHQKGAALSLRIPLTNNQLPSAQAILGSAKVTQGLDYRGVPVIATLRKVPDTPWLMVSKIDKAELFAPVNLLQRWVTGLGFAFAALGGALVFLWFKGYRARYAHLKIQHDAAVEREMLVKHFDYLTKYANDIVLLLNAEGRIVEANDRAALAYGYPKEKLKSMSLGALLAPWIDLRSRLEEIENKGGLKFESTHLRKNGATFPVESSVRAITIEGERYFQAIISDITERKLAESALRKREALLKSSKQMAHIGSWELDLKSNILFWSDETFRIFEIDPARFDASYEAFLDAVHSDDRAMVDKAYTDSLKNRSPYTIVHRLVFPNQRIKFVQEWCVTQYDQEGSPIRSIGTTQDITERKLAEERLSKSYKELEKLTTHLEAVREDEQKRIARELHDEMGGVLAALNVKVSLMAAHPPTEMADLMAEVGCLEKLVAAGIQAMRRTVTALRPTLLDEVGLKLAIESYVQEFETNTKIECDLRLPKEELALTENQSTAIFRIIQESLTNVAKHAKANRVSIVLSEWDTSLVLTVKDDGIGFDLNTHKAKSFGLLGIGERAAMVGGKAQITSAAGKGTTVRVSLPLTADRREDNPAQA